MNNKEKIIISLTTWSARINSIDLVLDCILNQTVKPDKIILNLAYDEVIPVKIEKYIERNTIEIFRTEDTKVYKKFLPTLKRYPEDCVINIDDDILYPPTMIEDLVNIHRLCPNNPICGNHMIFRNYYCHCGECSLTKKEFFGDWLDKIDADVIQNCKSSDIVFTYMATMSGHPYIPSEGYYGTGFQQTLNQESSYSSNCIGTNGVTLSLDYLISRFGQMPDLIGLFVENKYISSNLSQLFDKKTENIQEVWKKECDKIRDSKTYKLGNAILLPFKYLKFLSKK